MIIKNGVRVLESFDEVECTESSVREEILLEAREIYLKNLYYIQGSNFSPTIRGLYDDFKEDFIQCVFDNFFYFT